MQPPGFLMNPGVPHARMSRGAAASTALRPPLLDSAPGVNWELWGASGAVELPEAAKSIPCHVRSCGRMTARACMTCLRPSESATTAFVQIYCYTPPRPEGRSYQSGILFLTTPCNEDPLRIAFRRCVSLDSSRLLFLNDFRLPTTDPRESYVDRCTHEFIGGCPQL